VLRTDNAGVAVARNRAIETSRADLIAQLDGDDLYEPDYLAEMVAAIRQDRGIGFVSCNATLFGALTRPGRRFSDLSRQVPPVTLARVLSRDFSVFTAVIMRRAAFDAAGGYDPMLRTAEDFDLWIRILEIGWSGGYVARPLVRYRRRLGSLSSAWEAVAPTDAQVYAKAEARLAGRPEALLAANLRARVERQLAWEAGDAMIREGRTREGLALLSSSGASRRSARWAIAMPLMRALPWLARPLLTHRWRQRHALAAR
jgi:GT2 family glycosyltransferase